jgi:hypothetical protein
VPIVLVGTKADSKASKCVSPHIASKVADDMKAQKYVECSEKNTNDLDESLDDGIR